LDNALKILQTNNGEADIAKYLYEYANLYGDNTGVRYEYLVCFHIKYDDVNATGNHGVVTNQPIITYPMIVEMEASMVDEVKKKIGRAEADVQVNVQNVLLLRTFIQKDGEDDEDE